ncbi:hypothetical protein LCGC14_3086770 [marine sediment metagenome]|uniref:Uncharacterized protein n=1 Tax=marine sediment metagenome TaxID=412755 RepID=A0A0F8YJ74_9ZZZZ
MQWIQAKFDPNKRSVILDRDMLTELLTVIHLLVEEEELYNADDISINIYKTDDAEYRAHVIVVG